MKNMIASLVTVASLVFAATVHASETTTILKARRSQTASVATGVWNSNLSAAKSYAQKHGLPLIAVYSNGERCSHCVRFESSCNSSYFRKWMKSSGCVFVFAYYGDSFGSSVFSWCHKSQRTYPCVRVWWPKGGVDLRVMGDDIIGTKTKTAGGKKAVAYFKKKCSKFFAKPAVVKPYYVDFDANGGAGTMARVTAKVGTAFTLPANAFTYPDYSFLGWAKTAGGSVAYKNKVSVKNLTSVSNGVVTLYAKWRQMTYRTYYVGISATITMSDLKGWTTSSKVPGLKWTAKTGKWTGKPTKAGTYTVKFKKGSSSATRKIVVVRDAILFADENYADRVIAVGEEYGQDLTPSTAMGAPKSVVVTGLPDGLAYAGGHIAGTPAQVGTFTVKVTVVSAKSQTLTRTFPLEIGVPDCCIGSFNGFVGVKDGSAADVLAFSNRGTFRLTAPSNANLSAKIVTAKGTYSFTGLGWTRNGDGTYTAQLATSSGKDTVQFTVSDTALSLDESFCEMGVFKPSYGTSYDIWAQRAPFDRDASGAYLDATVATAMPKVVGVWYFKETKVGSAWRFSYATKKTATLTMTVAENGVAKLAGKVGSYAVSASSSVFVFTADVEAGFVRADFTIPVTVSKTKKTLDIWTNLWFDKSNAHVDARNEGVGVATVKSYN